MQITDKLLTPGMGHGRPGDKITPRGVVIHYVGNPGSSALANRNYFEKGSDGNCVSAHYVVGLQGEIIRCVPEDERANHAGKSYGNKWKELAKSNNFTLLGIEVCHPDTSGIFIAKTYDALVELTADICGRYGFDPLKDVYRHYDVSGKSCPLYYVNNPPEWIKLVNDIKAKTVPVDLTPILGSSSLGIDRFIKYRSTRNVTPKLTNGNFAELVNIYFEVAEIEGVRADIALCQAFLETGFFQYGGIVLPEQNNFAGLGALDGNGQSNCNAFPTVREGVIAHIQHLKGYATAEPLKLPCEDVRYKYIKNKGCAPWVEWLSIPNNPTGSGWASDKDYFRKIMEIFDAVKKA